LAGPYGGWLSGQKQLIMIISFSGRIGSGKDAAAQIVQEIYPEMNWQIKGFADKLRQVASLLTGIPAEDMKRQEVKERILGDEWSVFKCYFNYFGDDGKWINFEDVADVPDSSKTLVGLLDNIASNWSSPEQIDFPDWSTKPFSVRSRITLRTLLQKLGTQGIRDGVHPNSWVNALMCDYKPIGAHINNLMPGNVEMIGSEFIFSDKCRPLMPNWLVTDCRYPNEVEAIKSRGGTCIRIVRPDNPYPQSNHESETAIDHIEMLTIINDGNLEQLKLRIREAVEPIIKNLGK